MPTWDPKLYLKFEEERTQPCRDLIARINLKEPRRIADLGCGPGNSTVALAQRWSAAALTGIDSSADMIREAREHHPHIDWQQADISQWSADKSFDLVFANASLQWVGDHARVMPHLFAQVVPGGALAWQVPANMDAAAHRLMRELAASVTWRTHFTGPTREWFVHDLPFYYDLLTPRAARLDLWKTEYLHIVESPVAIVEWYKGTGLRPFLDQLPDASMQQRFPCRLCRRNRKSLSASTGRTRALSLFTAVCRRVSRVKDLFGFVAEDGTGRLAFFLAKRLADFFELLGAVVRLIPNVLADEDGRLGLNGEHEAVAGAGVDFDHLGMNLVLRAQNQAREVGVAAERVDDHPLDLDVEGVENIADELVGERPLVLFAAHRHGDGAADAGLDVDDKTFFLVADKDREGVLVGGKYAENFDAHDIRVHSIPIPL